MYETATTPTYVSPQEYLASERLAEAKREYIAGEIVAMAGTSRNHSLIESNVLAGLHGQLKGKSCETYGPDMRVRIDSTHSYVYPDVVVACGDIRFEDNHLDTLVNPTVVIEILSPSTASRDRGIKWQQYRRIPSLVDYLLVAQDQYRIEQWTRRSGDIWSTNIIEGLDGIVELASIGCRLELGDVYERVIIR